MKNKTTTKAILGSDAYWPVNRKLISLFKHERPPYLLAFLVDWEQYIRTQGQMVLRKDKEGIEREWFFATSEKIEEKTKVSYKAARPHLNLLKKAGFIDMKRMGVPAKQHFTIRHDLIVHFVTTSFDHWEELDLTKWVNYISRTKDQELRDQELRDQEEKGKEVPTPFDDFDWENASKLVIDRDAALMEIKKMEQMMSEELKDEHKKMLLEFLEKLDKSLIIDLTNQDLEKKKSSAKKRKAQFIPQAIELGKYLNELSGRKFEYTDESEWTKLLVGLLSKKHTPEDIRMVIEYKVWEWTGTDSSIYMRPSTIFGGKFKAYLADAKAVQNDPEYRKAVLAHKHKASSQGSSVGVGDITKDAAEELAKKF